MSMNFEAHHSDRNGTLNGLKVSILRLLNQVEHLTGDQPSRQRASGTCLSEEVRRFEIELITSALLETQGHQQRAARLLGVKLTTLNGKIKRYEIMKKLRAGMFDSAAGPDENRNRPNIETP